MIAVVLATIAFAPALSAPPHGLPSRDRLRAMVERSELVLLARVLAVDALARPDTLDASGGRLRAAHLEPIAWLKGGLDGDPIEVYMREGGETRRDDPPAWRALAGVDTLGALVALERHGVDWVLRADRRAGMPAGFLRVRQREFRAVRDAVMDAAARKVTP